MRRYRNRILWALLCFGLGALSLSAIPLLQRLEEGPRNAVRTLLAGLFWGGLLLGGLLTALAACGFRKYRRRAVQRGQVRLRPLPGILSFRLAHWPLYLVIALGLAAAISDLALHWLSELLMFPILSVTLMALVLHGVLDGNDYHAYAKMKEGLKNG